VVSSAGYTFAHRLRAGKPVFVPDDGEALWTLTTARDFARAVAGLAGNEAALGRTFHVTSDEATSWNRITAETARALGAGAPVVEKIPVDFICRTEPSLESKLRGDKANTAVFDNSAVRRAVPDFACRDRLPDGLAASAAWFDAHPDQERPDPGVDALWDRVIEAWRRR
jgi:nucleoside-diphosphate-sugar epimerase